MLIGLLAALCWVDHTMTPRGALLWSAAMFICLAASQEIMHMFRQVGMQPIPWATYVGALLVVFACGVPLFVLPRPSPANMAVVDLLLPVWIGGGLIVATLLCVVAAVFTFDGNKRHAANLAGSLFVVMYAGGLLAALVALRFIGTDAQHDRGLALLIGVILIVKAGDTGAYTVGRLIGRHKMSPRLSPGKTWEGAAGAILFSSAAAYLFFEVGRSQFGWISVSWGNVPLGWLVLGVTLSAFGMLGDLAESLLKRCADVKDSSTWMPGLGGVLDVFDSLIFAAPVAYALVVMGVLSRS